MEFMEPRYRTRSPNATAEDLGKAAVASIVMEPTGKNGSFWVQTEIGPMQKAERIVVDNVPVEDVEKIEEGIDSEDEELRREAEVALAMYVEPSEEESNVFFLNNQSYVEETIIKPSGRTRRKSTLITARRAEEHFTGETPVFTPKSRK